MTVWHTAMHVYCYKASLAHSPSIHVPVVQHNAAPATATASQYNAADSMPAQHPPVVKLYIGSCGLPCLVCILRVARIMSFGTRVTSLRIAAWQSFLVRKVKDTCCTAVMSGQQSKIALLQARCSLHCCFTPVQAV